MACGFEIYADANASYDIEVCHRGNYLANYVEEYVANTCVMGCLNLEGSDYNDRTAPMYCQTPTGVESHIRMVIIWDDAQCLQILCLHQGLTI